MESEVPARSLPFLSPDAKKDDTGTLKPKAHPLPQSTPSGSTPYPTTSSHSPPTSSQDLRVEGVPPQTPVHAQNGAQNGAQNDFQNDAPNNLQNDQQSPNPTPSSAPPSQLHPTPTTMAHTTPNPLSSSKQTPPSAGAPSSANKLISTPSSSSAGLSNAPYNTLKSVPLPAYTPTSLTYHTTSDCTSLCVSPSGTHLIAGFADGTVRLYPTNYTNHPGYILSHIQAKGLHTNLIMTLSIPPSGRYCFAGVLRGSVELTIHDLSTLEVTPYSHLSPHEFNTSKIVKGFKHLDAKLKGFGHATQVTDGSYRLFCGKGIKNIHIWSFIPPHHDLNGTDEPIWECIYDTQSNGMTVEYLSFVRINGVLKGASKSSDQCLRVWDLECEDSETKNRPENKRPKSYQDLSNTTGCLSVLESRAWCYTSHLTIVDLETQMSTDLHLPNNGSVGRRSRGYQEVERVTGVDGDVLLSVSDGKSYLYDEKGLNLVPGSSSSDPVNPRESRLTELFKVGSNNVVVAASSVFCNGVGTLKVEKFKMGKAESRTMQISPWTVKLSPQTVKRKRASPGKTPSVKLASKTPTPKQTPKTSTSTPKTPQAPKFKSSPDPLTENPAAAATTTLPPTTPNPPPTPPPKPAPKITYTKEEIKLEVEQRVAASLLELNMSPRLEVRRDGDVKKARITTNVPPSYGLTGIRSMIFSQNLPLSDTKMSRKEQLTVKFHYEVDTLLGNINNSIRTFKQTLNREKNSVKSTAALMDVVEVRNGRNRRCEEFVSEWRAVVEEMMGRQRMEAEALEAEIGGGKIVVEWPGKWEDVKKELL